MERETCPECGSAEFYTARHDGPQGLEDRVGGLFLAEEEPVRRATDAVVEPGEDGYVFSVDCPDCGERIAWDVDDLEEAVEITCPDCESVYKTRLSAGDTLREEIRAAGEEEKPSWKKRFRNLLP